MAIMGFSEDDLQKRSDCVHAMIAQYSNPVPVFMNLNTVFKGPPGNRVPTGVTLVEFPNREVRESVLAALQGKSLKDTKNKPLTIKRARTMLRAQRNTAIKDALDRIQKSGIGGGADAEIVWKEDGTSDRGVRIQGSWVFKQGRTDINGSFVGVTLCNSIFGV
jgi:hypothetical protein